MTRNVAIIDYGSGNLRSMAKSCERAAQETGHNIFITHNPEDIRNAERIILPGVGAFGDCIAGLNAIPGMVAALDEAVHTQGKPFLGVCVGMQLLAEEGYEHGTHQGLGWIKGHVEAIIPKDSSYKIPHMGWNELIINDNSHPVLQGINNGDHAYFVHSFHFVTTDKTRVLAEVSHGQPITAVVAQDTIIGTQFHPEKSQQTGLRLLSNFLQWKP